MGCSTSKAASQGIIAPAPPAVAAEPAAAGTVLQAPAGDVKPVTEVAPTRDAAPAEAEAEATSEAVPPETDGAGNASAEGVSVEEPAGSKTKSCCGAACETSCANLTKSEFKALYHVGMFSGDTVYHHHFTTDGRHAATAFNNGEAITEADVVDCKGVFYWLRGCGEQHEGNMPCSQLTCYFVAAGKTCPFAAKQEDSPSADAEAAQEQEQEQEQQHSGPSDESADGANAVEKAAEPAANSAAASACQEEDEKEEATAAAGEVTPAPQPVAQEAEVVDQIVIEDVGFAVVCKCY